MRNTAIILLLFAAIFNSCQKSLFGKRYVENENRFSFRRDSYIGKSFTDTLFYAAGVIQATGSIPIDNYGDTSQLKIGNWKEYYPNRNLRAEGSYRIGTYLQCCTGGLCQIHYNYKHGLWKYWHENGQLKAEGSYTVVTKHLRTSCEDGDNVQEHHINTDWNFFDEAGNKISASDKLIKALEEIRFDEFPE